ncbi:MAG TPA: dephospho-CoA kinase [Tissierellaceae bacterium]|nr:dephospho-CoA kinase [Tissierellaceae bacterium]
MIQNNCKIIGLTGGIASGKSTVSNILKDKGYKIIDADIIAREIIEINKPAYKDIINFFGDSIINKDKTINREELGNIVFSDSDSLKILNNITHPYIYKSMKEYIKKYCDKNILFLDIPLLFEEIDEIKKYSIGFDEIWLVYTDEDRQIKRLIKRDNFTRDEAKERIQTQMSMEEKINLSSKVIDNRKDILNLKENVERLLKDL